MGMREELRTFMGAFEQVAGLAIDGERVGDVWTAARLLRLPDDVDRVRIPPLACPSTIQHRQEFQ